jgi:F-type H+-transporting ATPase subunit b
LIPDITALWVIVLLLTCIFLLNTLVFRPILQVIEARMEAVSGARELAQQASEKAALAAAEYDKELNEARSHVYREMDEKRRVALDERAAVVGETRGIVERELGEATERVQQEAAAARQTIDREAEALAGAIVTRVLGRAS